MALTIRNALYGTDGIDDRTRDQFLVYESEYPVVSYAPSAELVPDAPKTGERWLLPDDDATRWPFILLARCSVERRTLIVHEVCDHVYERWMACLAHNGMKITHPNK